LPPETKIIQQASFNERSGNIKFLIATDAIGMGMNLNINRVIFASLWKHSFISGRHRIGWSAVLQIAGRAGRYMNDGYVTAFHPEDLRLIRKYIERSNDPIAKISTNEEIDKTYHERTKYYKDMSHITSYQIKNFKTQKFTIDQKYLTQAYIFPPLSQIEAFAELKNQGRRPVDDPMHFSDVLSNFQNLATMKSNFNFKNIVEECAIADAIENIPNLTLKERFNFIKAPLRVRIDKTRNRRKGNR